VCPALARRSAQAGKRGREPRRAATQAAAAISTKPTNSPTKGGSADAEPADAEPPLATTSAASAAAADDGENGRARSMTRKPAGEKKPLPVRKSSAHSQSKDPDEEESDIGGSLPPRDGSLDAAGHVKGAWSAEEDANLVRLVGQMGCKKWSLIAQSMPGRIGKQVSALRSSNARRESSSAIIINASSSFHLCRLCNLPPPLSL
jgi:hypothetical protein